MPRIHGDTEDMPDRIGLVESGRWKSELLDCWDDESQAGNEMLVWEWQISEGPSEGLSIRSYSITEGDNLGQLKEHMLAFGVTGSFDIRTDDLIGKSAMLVVGNNKRVDRDGNERESSMVNALHAVREKERSGRGRGRGRDRDEETTTDRPRRTRASSSATSKAKTSHDREAPARRSSSDDDDLPF